ncbi:hypothetical protein L1887_07333 [Cichorium endivia]|nr:hypothetical protein L1887_07333 [Cichorium endivia]
MEPEPTSSSTTPDDAQSISTIHKKKPRTTTGEDEPTEKPLSESEKKRFSMQREARWEKISPSKIEAQIILREVKAKDIAEAKAAAKMKDVEKLASRQRRFLPQGVISSPES